MEDIVARYNQLDRLYEEVKALGRLKTAQELGKTRLNKERGGVYIHIGRHGQAIFAGAGYHRLAMAIALSLPRIPAMIGAVHPEALDELGPYVRDPRPSGVDCRPAATGQAAHHDNR